MNGNVYSAATGAQALNGGMVIIEGTLTALGTPFVRVASAGLFADMAITDGVSNGGYTKFIQSPSYVWARSVSNAANVCQIGATPYPTVKAALDSVANGGTATVTMTANSNETTPIVISGKTINLQMGSYNIDLQDNTVGGLLTVENGGKLIQSGTGKFNITGGESGIFARGVNTVVTIRGDVTGKQGVSVVDSAKITVIGDVEATGIDNTGVYALNDAVVTVTGNVTAIQTDGVGANADNGAKITITGSVEANDTGVRAYDGGKVTVESPAGGAATVTATDGTGAYATGKDANGNGVEIMITGNVTGLWNGIGVEYDAKITVTGNVTGADPSIDGMSMQRIERMCRSWTLKSSTSS